MRLRRFCAASSASRAVAPGAGTSGYVARVLLLLRRQRRQALETHCRVGLLQRRVHADALVEDETFTAIVRAATFLEVLENAAVQLQHIAETLRLHVGAGLLAADAAGAEHHDGFVLELGRQPRHGSRKVAEMVDADRQCILERAQLHLVVVARVEQGQRPTFIQPRFQLLRRELRRGTPRRLDARHAKGDDLLLDAHQHAPERLVRCVAEFRLKLRESLNRPQAREQGIDSRTGAGHEQVDAFRAEQDRSAQLVRTA